MLSPQDNELLTRIGPGTAMGVLMRRYWQPVLYASELPDADGDPVRVRLLGENLIAFRDTDGKVGLLGEQCPHRGASLFFGRNEECGLRCVYHGWKFDVRGQCVDMPNELSDSTLKHRVHTTAYPCIEIGGVIFAYMGEGEPPAPPDMEWLKLPDSHRFMTKRYHECNWAQALEGDLDSSHVGFLHSRLDRGVPGFGSGQRVNGNYDTIGHHLQPRLETHETDFGMWVAARRPNKDGGHYWRATALMLPFYTFIPPSGDAPIHLNIWQPVDDENTLVWSIQYHGGRPLRDDERTRLGSGLYEHYGPEDLLPPTPEPAGRWRSKANRANDFLIDRAAQRTTSFTGLRGFWRQDRAVVESMGPRFDRAKEYLVSTDIGIVRFRRMMLRAAQELQDQGKAPPGLDPATQRIRSVAAVLPEDASWIEAISALSAAERVWTPAP